jgi:putative transposase
MSNSFNFDEALKDLQAGKDLTGKDGILMPLIKQLTEAAITAELDHHLANSNEANRKNGKGSKIIKTGTGSFELNAPRDRFGTFEPQLIRKNQTQLTPGIDRKILSLFSHGMSYRDMKHHIHDMYGIEVSTGAITAIIDQLKQARHYFCESLFWASQPKQAAKITWQLMPSAPRFVLRSCYCVK